MTGLPEFNFPAFADAAARLRRLGFDVVNPAELNGPGLTWQECMRTDLAQLVTCGAVITLDGWEKSRGASLEVHVARALGLVVAGLRDLLPVRAEAAA